MSIVIMTLAIGSTSMTVGATKSLSETNKERAIALDAVENLIEEIRGVDPSEVFARYNATTADDLELDDPGSTFEVAALTPSRNDADGIVGVIEFPGDGVELREDFENAEMGMGSGPLGVAGRDLDLDGVIDGLDHSADYAVLPMRVRCEWEGASGVQSVEVTLVITGQVR